MLERYDDGLDEILKDWTHGRLDNMLKALKYVTWVIDEPRLWSRSFYANLNQYQTEIKLL